MHCVDLGESFTTSICLQNLASIEPRTDRLKFGGMGYGRPPCIFTFSHVYYFHFPLSTYTFNSPKYLDIFQRRGHAHIFSDKNPLKIIRALIFFVSFQYLSVLFNFGSAAEATSFRFHKNKRDVSHIEWMNHLQKPKWLYTEPNIIIIIQDYYILMLKLEKGKRNSILTNLLNIVTTSSLIIGEWTENSITFQFVSKTFTITWYVFQRNIRNDCRSEQIDHVPKRTPLRWGNHSLASI